MPKAPSFRRKGRVSIWVGLRKPNVKRLERLDILKDLCGVSSYNLDDQEVAGVTEEFAKAPVQEVLKELSYSSSFLAAAIRAAGDKKINHAYWAVAQYDFAYDPMRALGKVAADPTFVGAFAWDDSEDDEVLGRNT